MTNPTAREKRARLNLALLVAGEALALFIFNMWLIVQFIRSDPTRFWDPIFALTGFWTALTGLLYTRAQTFSEGAFRRRAVKSAEAAMSALISLAVADGFSWIFIELRNGGIPMIGIPPLKSAGELEGLLVGIPGFFFMYFSIGAAYAVYLLAEGLSFPEQD